MTFTVTTGASRTFDSSFPQPRWNHLGTLSSFTRLNRIQFTYTKILQEVKNLYKSCILSTEFNSPPNLVRDKGIYSTRASYLRKVKGKLAPIDGGVGPAPHHQSWRYHLLPTALGWWAQRCL